MAFTLEAFTNQYPRLYHFTPASNRANLVRTGRLRTAASLIDESGRGELLNVTRPDAVAILCGSVTLNDQQPLRNCDNMEFVRCLNHLVFFWKGSAVAPSFKAKKFADKYKKKGYGCLRVPTQAVFNDAQNPPLFCIVNSGAPSPEDFFDGERQPGVFWPCAVPPLALADVKEVVFRNDLVLPQRTEWKDATGEWEPLFPEAAQ